MLPVVIAALAALYCDLGALRCLLVHLLQQLNQPVLRHLHTQGSLEFLSCNGFVTVTCTSWILRL